MKYQPLLIALLLSFLLSCQSMQQSASMAFDNANSVLSTGTDEDVFWGKADGSEPHVEQHSDSNSEGDILIEEAPVREEYQPGEEQQIEEEVEQTLSTGY